MAQLCYQGEGEARNLLDRALKLSVPSGVQVAASIGAALSSARPVHLITTMIRWMRTSGLSINQTLSFLQVAASIGAAHSMRGIALKCRPPRQDHPRA